MGIFWNLWIIGLTLACLVLVLWVLLANRKVAVSDDEEAENRTTGHVYDGIEEYDNPLPRWWFNLFIATVVYAAIYLVVYPGLGSFRGVIGWTSTGELAGDQKAAAESYEEIYAAYAKTPIEELANDPAAQKMGIRIFSNNCAVCHGSDAGGFFGFPNLSDKDWLYGGAPDEIVHSIVHGRKGNMPAWGALLGTEKSEAAAHYVLSLSGAEHDVTQAEVGKAVYLQSCAACHGLEGKGLQAIGAPNLTDDIWLYGGDFNNITATILNGRANEMPAQKDLLREEKIHIVAAYVYSLSQEWEDEQ